MQLLPNPGFFHVLLILLHHLWILLSRRRKDELIIKRISSLDPRFYRCMRSLDLQDIHKPSTTTDHQPSRKSQFRYTEIPTWVQSSCPIRNALTSFKEPLDFRMRLEPLELLVRIDVRIFIVKTHDKPDMNVIWSHVIKERPCVCFRIQRPPDWMLNVPWLEQRVISIDFPNFFQPDSVQLWICIFSQLKLIHNVLWQWASATFSQNCLLGQNLDPSLESILDLSLLGNSKISSCHSFHTSVIIEK